MALSREQILAALSRWNRAWDEHDLEGVIALFHENVLFDNWTGALAKGKEALRKGWAPWFAQHRGFKFTGEDTFVDERNQKVLYRWRLDWPSLEEGFKGKPETRRGVDVIHFKDGKIIQKLTYSKTTVEIDGRRVKLVPERR